jgi:RNA polymerase sigma factor (sigma-70 family)
MTDSELLAGIQNGNDQALVLLYKLHYKMVSHFVLNNNGGEEDAKEVYHEAIILFYEKVREGSLQLTCKISTYLYSVCRRMWLRKLAIKSHYVGQIEDFEAFIEWEGGASEGEEESYLAMDASLGLLGEPCRTVMEEYYLHHQSMKQICLKMGYANEETAKNQKYKCLMRLKKLFFGLYQTKEG